MINFRAEITDRFPSYIQIMLMCFLLIIIIIVVVV